MIFSLMRYEAPSDSLRRIVLDQIDGAILQLARDDNLNEGIHEARKHFKRVRAVVAVVARRAASRDIPFRKPVLP